MGPYDTTISRGSSLLFFILFRFELPPLRLQRKLLGGQLEE